MLAHAHHVCWVLVLGVVWAEDVTCHTAILAIAAAAEQRLWFLPITRLRRKKSEHQPIRGSGMDMDMETKSRFVVQCAQRPSGCQPAIPLPGRGRYCFLGCPSRLLWPLAYS